MASRTTPREGSAKPGASVALGGASRGPSRARRRRARRAAAREAIATASAASSPPRRSAAAKPGARHAAERPAGVQRGHDRPAEVLLDLDAVAVHRDVLRRAGRAEHEQPERDQQPGCGASTGRLTASAQAMPPTQRHAHASRGGRSPGRRSGSATITATAMPTMTRPIALLERSKRSCTHGICATQVPIAAPLTKKTPVVAQRGAHARVTVTPAARYGSSSSSGAAASATTWVSSATGATR